MNDQTRIPRLAVGVRFRRMSADRAVLLVPEGVVNLNPTAAAVVELVDGERSSATIAAQLHGRFAGEAGAIAADVEDLLNRLAARGLVFFSPSQAAP